MKRKYFHTILNKYNKQLEEYDVTVADINSKCKREVKAEELIPIVEKELNNMFKKPLLLVKVEDLIKGHKKIIAPTAFYVTYLHDNYASRIIIHLYDLLTSKWVDVSVNSYVVEELDSDVKFLDVLEKLKEERK